MDNFKKDFKYFKQKSKKPDLSNVRCLSSGEKLCIIGDAENVFGVNSVELYFYQDLPGVYGIENAFSPAKQAQWVLNCLTKYTTYSDCVTNVDSFHDVPIRDSQTLLLNNLRWLTLGYHHDWNSKVYNLEKKSTFPDNDFQPVCSPIAAALGYPNYTAEASIINYYPIGTTLSGHTDHSEVDKESPLISISFGQTAIFLVGGTSKEVVPVPFFLRSGDIIVMMKEARLNYHGVPCVFSEPKARLRWGDSSYLEPWQVDYIEGHRINVNIRQVVRIVYSFLNTIYYENERL